MNIPYVPVAIGAAGVAAVLGYLYFSSKKPGPTAAAPTKTAPKKTGGATSTSIGPISTSSTAKKDWRLLGYRAGIAQGKADKAKGSGFFDIPSRVVSGEKMPGTPGASSSDPMAIASWTQGYSDGYPVGYGKVGAIAPKYAVEGGEEDGGVAEMSTTTEETTTETDSSSSEGTSDAETETSGVEVGQVLVRPAVDVDVYHHSARPIGAWGPQRHVLAYAKRGAFSQPLEYPRIRTSRNEIVEGVVPAQSFEEGRSPARTGPLAPPTSRVEARSPERGRVETPSSTPAEPVRPAGPARGAIAVPRSPMSEYPGDDIYAHDVHNREIGLSRPPPQPGGPPREYPPPGDSRGVYAHDVHHLGAPDLGVARPPPQPGGPPRGTRGEVARPSSTPSRPSAPPSGPARPRARGWSDGSL